MPGFLVQTIDRLGQRIVIGAADRSDRGLDACLGEPLAEPDGRILRTPICMVDNIVQIEHTFLVLRSIQLPLDIGRRPALYH